MFKVIKTFSLLVGKVVQLFALPISSGAIEPTEQNPASGAVFYILEDSARTEHTDKRRYSPKKRIRCTNWSTVIS